MAHFSTVKSLNEACEKLPTAVDVFKSGLERFNTENFRLISELEEPLSFALEISASLKHCDMQLAPEQAVQGLNGSFNLMLEWLTLPDQLESDTPDSYRTRLRGNISELKDALNGFITHAPAWIYVLSYLRADQNPLDKALSVVDSVVLHCSARKVELDKIIDEARTNALNIGVTRYSSSFRTRAGDLGTSSLLWLAGAVILLLSGLAIIIKPDLLFSLSKAPSQAELVQYVTSRVMSVAILLGAAMWAGRIYKAEKHQIALNLHRANALDSFTNFANAAGDSPDVRHAVLLEATRCIYALSPNGYIDAADKAGDAMPPAVEVLRSVLAESKK